MSVIIDDLPTRPALGLTEPEFNTWLISSVSGESITYYSGFLAMDREERHYKERTPRAVLAGRVGRAAMSAWEAGFVDLVQRRKGPRRYEYIAIKRGQVVSDRKNFWSMAVEAPT